MLVIYRGHQARDGATYPPGCGCVALLDPFSSAKPQPNYPQMRPRVKYGGARSHPGLQPSCILNPHNDESSTALHTCFGGCVAILGPFSLRETDPKNAQTTSTAKYGSAQLPKTPTRTLYDNKTSTVPHTRFGGDLHYVIPDPTNAQARLRAKHRNARFGGCLARLGELFHYAVYHDAKRAALAALLALFMVLSPSTKPDKAEIRAHAQPLKTPTSDSPRSIWIKHGATHPLRRVCGSMRSVPFPMQKPTQRGHDQPPARHFMRSPSPECPAPKYDDQPNLVPRTRFSGCDNIRSPLTPTHEATPPRAQICQSARISCARDLIQPTTTPSPKQNPTDKDTTRKPATRLTEHPQE
ncbi:hypothetical protein BS47DRAFT_1365750 [Hydnum rufescens UP504]|uniref:Uncharacterized protein n=1 Tax=Hydnum rufescens UP504 TaxID=1448309 RepID=A0A9P6AMT6_9AGAM|nr:hypothetical protein BS47DRAFT_1365750 [Hydnum rufescens UP504]